MMVAHRRCRRRLLFFKIEVRPRSCQSYHIWRPCDNRLFIVHEDCKLKIPAEHVVYTNCCFCFVLTFRTIFVHNMFYRCCEFLKKIYLYIIITVLHFKDLTWSNTFKLPTFFGHYSTNLITVDFSTHVVFYRVFTNQVG